MQPHSKATSRAKQALSLCQLVAAVLFAAALPVLAQQHPTQREWVYRENADVASGELYPAALLMSQNTLPNAGFGHGYISIGKNPKRPVEVEFALQLSSRGIGLLASMEGLGAVAGSLVLLALSSRLRQGPVYVGGVLLFLCMMPAFALSTLPWLSGATLVLIGAGQASFAVMQSTLVYVNSPPERRLEAFGLLTMCIGVAPVGFLLMGWLAERLGAPWAIATIAAAGATTMAVSWRVWWSIVSGMTR